MIPGIALTVLRQSDLENSVQFFLSLQRQHPLSACEVTLEASLHESGCWPDAPGALQTLRTLRDRVQTLGVHLPFMDLNPVSANLRVRDSSLAMLHQSLAFAGRIGDILERTPLIIEADYRKHADKIIHDDINYVLEMIQ